MAKTRKTPAPAAQCGVAGLHPQFCEDLRFWVETDRKVARRAFDLIEAILRDPSAGIGKPEPLRSSQHPTHCTHNTHYHNTQRN